MATIDPFGRNGTHVGCPKMTFVTGSEVTWFSSEGNVPQGDGRADAPARVSREPVCLVCGSRSRDPWLLTFGGETAAEAFGCPHWCTVGFYVCPQCFSDDQVLSDRIAKMTAFWRN